MLSLRFHQLPHARQRGDTIVEVLISLTVISLVLGGAYVTTNKSLIATRSAQERSNALKLAESQIEQIKGLIATSPTTVFGGAVPSPFCVYTDTSTSTVKLVAATDVHCIVDTSGAATTAEPKFKLSVTRSVNDFTVKNTWNDLSGNVTDQLQLKYRAYQ
jgi:type II secretory pathway pseudopilin PulG